MAERAENSVSGRLEFEREDGDAGAAGVKSSSSKPTGRKAPFDIGPVVSASCIVIGRADGNKSRVKSIRH